MGFVHWFWSHFWLEEEALLKSMSYGVFVGIYFLCSGCNTLCWRVENKKAPWIGAFIGIYRAVPDSLKYIFGGAERITETNRYMVDKVEF